MASRTVRQLRQTVAVVIVASMSADTNTGTQPPARQPVDQPAAPPPDAAGDPAGKPLPRPREIGGPKGPEPTRYGDWQFNGRCTDF
jgi:hypothetical protein